MLRNSVWDFPRDSSQIYGKLSWRGAQTTHLSAPKQAVNHNVLLFNFALLCAPGASAEPRAAQGGIRWTVFGGFISIRSSAHGRTLMSMLISSGNLNDSSQCTQAYLSCGKARHEICLKPVYAGCRPNSLLPCFPVLCDNLLR